MSRPPWDPLWGVTHTTSTLPPALSSLTLLELSQQLARQCDLPLLSTGLGVITLVVTTEQQDDLGPIEVNEHPEEDSLAVRARVGSVATEHLSALVGVMSDTKLRSEERRGGKECVGRGRARWSPYLEKKKKHKK